MKREALPLDLQRPSDGRRERGPRRQGRKGPHSLFSSPHPGVAAAARVAAARPAHAPARRTRSRRADRRASGRGREPSRGGAGWAAGMPGSRPVARLDSPSQHPSPRAGPSLLAQTPPSSPAWGCIPELRTQGPRLRGREVAGLGSAPGKVWTWESPCRPAGEGARDGRASAVAPEPPPRRARLSPARAPSRPAASPGGDRLSIRGRRALLPRGAAGLHPGPRLGTPASGRILARSGSGVRSEEPRESGSERGSRGGECARVWRSERARECACLTRGEVCKGRIPSFLPQPLVETRRMQRPPGRSAAPRRAEPSRRRPPGRTPQPAGEPGPRSDRAPPSPAGPEGSFSPVAGSGKAPGGVLLLLLLLPAPIRAKGAPPGGELAPSLPWRFSCPEAPVAD